MIAVAQDAQGAARVSPALAEMQIDFPVLVDERSLLARELGFRIVPAGVLLDVAGAVAYASDDDFDIGDPRLRASLESFMAGKTATFERQQPMSEHALELFAKGVALHVDGHAEQALTLWREALRRDPGNFLIRSQIWAAEHPERFWPVVDREWQERQLMKEGYDGPLP